MKEDRSSKISHWISSFDPVFERVRSVLSDRNEFFFLLPASIFYIPFLLFPAVLLIAISFFEWNIVGDFEFIGIENYEQIFSNPTTYRALLNNFLFVIHHLLEMGIALLLALGIRNAHPKIRPYVRTIILLPVASLIVGIAVLWSFMYNPNFGIINTAIQSIGINWDPIWLGNPTTALPALMIASSWQFIGFSMIIWFVGLGEVDQSLYEAARIDGAGRLAIFYHITFPQLKPAALFLLIFNTIRAFRRFPLVWVMTEGGPGRATEVMVTYIYRTAFSLSSFGVASALSVVLFVITLAVSLISLRYVWGESTTLKKS